MAIDTVLPDENGSRSARRSCAAPLTVLAAALVMATVGSGILRGDRPSSVVTARTDSPVAVPVSPDEAPRADAGTEAPASEPSAVAHSVPDSWRDAIGGPLSRWAWSQIDPPALTPVPEAENAETPRLAMTVPLPVPRPPEFRAPGFARSRTERRVARRELAPMPNPAPPADERSFLEKLFGVERAPGLAYAALESKPADLVPQRRVSPPLPLAKEPGPTAGVAVYNIITRTVTLPSGERLEAHSGLGEGLDDPRLINVRMRGPTPPGTYDLTEREQLFHGVRAIRLTPVGGSEAIYGRVGLLAHTFMLGPRGDSNGCVSFRDYDRFLQAFLRGEVQRLVVVTGTQDAPPSLAEGAIRTRLARNGG